MDILQKNGSKRPFLPEIDAQTFWYTLYGVPTACCVSYQIPKTQQGNLLVSILLSQMTVSEIYFSQITDSKILLGQMIVSKILLGQIIVSKILLGKMKSTKKLLGQRKV